MLSVNPIARVVVNAVRSSASPTVFDTGLLLVRDASFSDARRLVTCDSSAAALAQMTEWGFTDTSEPYKAALKYFAASPSPSRLLLSCYPSSETLVQALSAVLDLTASFYGIALGQAETDERILGLETFISGLDRPLMLFVPVVGSASSAVASDSLLQTLSGRASKRAVPFFCAAVSDTAALMGTAMGLELSHTGSAFALCYKTINGIQPSALTETEANAIKALNGNVYLTRGYTHLLLEKGTVSSGSRYDEILYLDRIADDLQNAAVSLLAENPDRLPQTDDSTAQFINRFTSILSGYADRGVLASGLWRGAETGPLLAGDTVENGFALWADSYDNQSDADRAAHKAVPIQVGLILAGSIESIVITVNVTV